MKQPNQKERRQLCADLAKIYERCFRAGLYLTAQKMKASVEQIGYECFEQFEKETRQAQPPPPPRGER